MSIEIYLAYVAACILITIIPGPTVTLIIANSLTHGMRAGLLNVAGTQLGLAIMLGVLLVGLSSIIATMGVLVRLGAHRGRDLSRLARLEAAARERRIRRDRPARRSRAADSFCRASSC